MPRAHGKVCRPTNVVPTPPWKSALAGDPSSTDCAHTFYLGVRDRVIGPPDYFGWKSRTFELMERNSSLQEAAVGSKS
jgi:hypothetical protein